MHYTHWNIPAGATRIPKALTDAGCGPLLAAVLCARGLETPEAALAFLDCGAEALSAPGALADMDRAVARLRRAIADGETVAVYGDYDVDGITSTCMLTDYLRARGVNALPYIPDRIEEGYGVNRAAVERLRAAGVTLIVTVDCGVTAVEEAQYARSLGVDMLITDHHECRELLPDAAAVVDPKRPDNGAAGRELAGVGVAFKLLCALEGGAEAVLARYADLVAVGTVADVMPLRGENRAIVRCGLRKLSEAPRPGLRALIRGAGLSEDRITATGIGFTLSPRLNASGRLGQADAAVELLLSEDAETAEACADALCRLNRERQEMEKRIWDEADRQLRARGTPLPDAPIVLAHEGWHQGVIGIVASRLTEKYRLPAVMICLDGEKGKGSCRSCGGFNLFAALSACESLLLGFGGHALAAGLTIRRENIDAFRAALADYYRANPGDRDAPLEIEVAVDAPELLELGSVADLERLEPCGAGNPRPVVCLTGARCAELVPLGGGKHTRLRLEQFGQVYEAVFFGRAPRSLDVWEGLRVDAAFTPQINEYRARRSVQLLLCDVRAHDAAARALCVPEPVAAGTVPTRERDFVPLWNALRDAGGSAEGTPDALWRRLAPASPRETCFLCLRVLAELELLTLDFEGPALRVCAAKGARKTDLERSPLLRRLRAEAL